MQFSEAQINKLAEAMTVLPDSTQTAIRYCLPNVPYGSFWGLVSREELTKEKIQALRADSKIFTLPVVDGVIIELANGYIEQELTPKFPFFFTPELNAESKRMAIEAEKSFCEFIEKAKKKGGYAGYLGIYSKNKVDTVTIQDKDYSAFRVDIFTALNVFKRYGVKVKLCNTLVPADTMLNELNSKNPSNVCKSLLMSPTRRAVFIQVVI